MQSTPLWRFGPFEADAAEHQLRRDGEVVAVTRKSFALLATLLSRPGKLFTKAELFEIVWAGTVVTDAALSRAIRELRVALGDDAAAPRYIATAHGLGFRFVALVSHEPGTAVAPDAEAPARPRLVGRDVALARLDQAWADARGGRRRIVFVTGEAGIGKTALVEAFIERHAGSGEAWTAQGRCIEQYGTGEAYLPILEALERLARQVGAGAFRDVLERYAPAWLAQLPWLAHDGDAAPQRRALAETTPQRMLREIAHALEVLAVEKTIVLWLEDLHWSDPSSLAVVSFLAGRSETSRLLLVASFRPADALAAASPLQGLKLQLIQRGQASELVVDLLDERAVAAYLGLRLGASSRIDLPGLAAFVFRRTDGNALFTVAIVDDLVRRGVLAKAGGDWVLTRSVDELGDGLPDDLRHLVHEQIERLDEADRRLVEAAAVAGTDFSAASLAAALDTAIADTEDRCLRLAQQGRLLRVRSPVLWPDGTVASGFGFLHALYWQGAYERVPPGRRADWHGRIGLRQEQAFGAQCAPIAAELAMRFEAARDPGRCLRYLEMAGASALSRCAYQECVDLMTHALSLVAALPADERARHEIELLLTMGVALMAAQGYASGDVEATYRRALALCEAQARPRDVERVLRGLWNVAFLRAELARAREIAEQLLAQATASGNARLAADAHAKLGQTCVHLGEWGPARVHLEQALARAHGADPAVVWRDAPRIAIYLSWVLWYTGFPDQALRQADEARRLADVAGSPHSSAFAIGYAAQLHCLRGDAAKEIEQAEQLLALSTEHGLTYWRLLAEFTQARASASDVDRDRSIDAMQRAIEDMRAGGGLVGVPYLLCLLAETELAGGRFDAARAALAEATALVAANGNASYAAEALRLQGEVELAAATDPAGRRSAEERFAAALALAAGQGARALELRAATSLARLWREDGQNTRARVLLGPIMARFGEGLATADLVRAKALLAVIARAGRDDVGDAASQGVARTGTVVPPPK